MTTTLIPAIGFIEAAAMLGITTSSDDFPRPVAAINRAYSRGLQEGAALPPTAWWAAATAPTTRFARPSRHRLCRMRGWSLLRERPYA